MKIKSNKEVQKVLDNYPKNVRIKLLSLRRLISDTAEESDEITEIEETLKWGEPSYLNKFGSTLRMDWKSKKPEQYAMYFKCTSKLVPTFKNVFGNKFDYEENRAIVFKLEDEIPELELKKCIKATLLYQKVKNIPNLGIE
jgi:hypothetical protein